MTVSEIFLVSLFFVWLAAGFIYKILDHYAHSITKFKETPLGQRIIPLVETKTAQTVIRAAN